MYTFQVYNVNIGYEQIVDPGRMISYSAKFLGGENIFRSEWTHSRKKMLKDLHKMLSEAEAVVTFNGDRFDHQKISGEFLLAGLPPAPPVASIDLIKTIRKQGFVMNRLAFIGPLLKVGEKIKHEGFGLWRDVMDRVPKALKKFEKYNREDTDLTERLYLRIRPYIKNHPYVGDEPGGCPHCQSKNAQSRGYYRTKTYRTQRLRCNDCGAWRAGKREKIA